MRFPTTKVAPAARDRDHVGVTPQDLTIRNATYQGIARLGRAPTSAEVADATGTPAPEVEAAWVRLHDSHALVLDEQGRIRMLNPFSAVETPFVVEAGGRTWFGNCGWDAFGIGVVLRTDSVVRTTCPDCDEPIDLDVRGHRPTDTSAVFHVLVPAREWWNDIGFT